MSDLLGYQWGPIMRHDQSLRNTLSRIRLLSTITDMESIHPRTGLFTDPGKLH